MQKPSWGRRGGSGGSHADFPGVEISIARGVGEMLRGNYCDRFFFFSLFFFFSNHMFIVSTVQEMTCIVNNVAKSKPKIKLAINK